MLCEILRTERFELQAKVVRDRRVSFASTSLATVTTPWLRLIDSYHFALGKRQDPSTSQGKGWQELLVSHRRGLDGRKTRCLVGGCKVG